MILFTILIVIVVIAFLLNEYYFYIVLSSTQEIQILKGKKRRKKYDWIAFGSSYCRYGLSSSEDGVGFNFGVAAQFLYYSDKMLREYAVSCLKNKGTVFLIIADLVFAEVGRGLYGADRYQLLLSKESLGGEYSIITKLKLRFPLFSNPMRLKTILRYIIKGDTNNYSTLSYNSLNEEKALAAAKQRCKDWCDQFGLTDTYSTEITMELEEKFSKSRDILTGMIQFCYDHDYKPVLVVTPVSGIMNSQLGDAFIKKVLFDNIVKANLQGAPLLDYLKDERFQDISLYHNNADFLNAKGRKIFTEVLLHDANKLEIQ